MIVDGVYFSRESLDLIRNWQQKESMATFYIEFAEKLSNWFLDNSHHMMEGINILEVLIMLRDMRKDITTIINPALSSQDLTTEAEDHEDFKKAQLVYE